MSRRQTNPIGQTRKLPPEPGSYGLGNVISNMQGKLDVTKSVTIPMRNTNDGKYFIFQGGKQVAMATCIMLGNVYFLDMGSFGPVAVGKIALRGGDGTTAEAIQTGSRKLPARIMHHPKKGFITNNLTREPKPTHSARCVVFVSEGVYGSYTDSTPLEFIVRRELKDAKALEEQKKKVVDMFMIEHSRITAEYEERQKKDHEMERARIQKQVLKERYLERKKMLGLR